MNQAASLELNNAHFDVCIIGAGIAGLSAAQTFSAKNLNVAVLEKSRGPGGRMATRRIDDAAFNHGVPSFTIESAAFSAWAHDDARKHSLKMPVNRASSGTICTTTTANSSMNLLARSTFTPANFYTLVRVTGLALEGSEWQVQYQNETAQGDVTSTGRLTAKKIVLALPAPQAAALLAPLSDQFAALAEFAASVDYAPCWVAMFSLTTPSNIETDELGQAIFKQPQNQFAKCVRQPTASDATGENWVVHATTQWTNDHLSDPKDMAANALFSGFSKHFNYLGTTANCAAHRWLYSQPESSRRTNIANIATFEEAAKHGLLCVGDWVNHRATTPTMCNLERAWLSGALLEV